VRTRTSARAAKSSTSTSQAYLLDALNAISEDDVAIEMGGALDPGVIKPVGATDFIGVIMPMRI
jgi:DNA polymerase III sliding clamp (beta) subunit (PCNA family)